MADADPSQSETTDFPVLIGCSFFVRKKNLDSRSFFTYLFFLYYHVGFSFIIVFFSLARQHLYAHRCMHVYPHTHIKTWPQSVGVSLSGCQMSCNCVYHLQHSFSVKAFSCSTEARCSIVIQQCHTCATHASLPVDHSLLLPSHLHQGLACRHYDT